MRGSGFLLATLAVSAYGAPLQPVESANQQLAPRQLEDFDIGKFLRKLGPLGDAVQRVVDTIPLGFSLPPDLGKRSEKQSEFALDIADLVKTLGPLGESIRKLINTLPIAVLPGNDDKINKREKKDKDNEKLASDLGGLLKVLDPVGKAVDKVFGSVPVDISLGEPLLPGSKKGDAGPSPIGGKDGPKAGKGQEADTALNLGDLLKVLGPMSKAVEELKGTIPAKISGDVSVLPGDEKSGKGIKEDLGPVDFSLTKRDKKDKKGKKGNLAVSLGDLLSALDPVGKNIDELIHVIPVDASVAVPVLPKDKDCGPLISGDAGPIKVST